MYCFYMITNDNIGLNVIICYHLLSGEWEAEGDWEMEREGDG